MLNVFGVCLIIELFWSSREVSRGTDHALFHSSCVDLGFAALCPRKLFCLNLFFSRSPFFLPALTTPQGFLLVWGGFPAETGAAPS